MKLTIAVICGDDKDDACDKFDPVKQKAKKKNNLSKILILMIRED